LSSDQLFNCKGWLNRRLLRTEKYDTILAANDEVEIVTFVGGGG